MMTASIPAFDPQRLPRNAGTQRVELTGRLLISMRAHCADAHAHLAELIPHRRP